jgi:hypothetical protein
MSESIFRWEADAQAGPVRESLLKGARMLLVRIRMFNPPAESDCPASEPTPDVLCDLRPEEARHLALELLQAAEDADRQTRRANWWQETARSVTTATASTAESIPSRSGGPREGGRCRSSA